LKISLSIFTIIPKEGLPVAISTKNWTFYCFISGKAKFLLCGDDFTQNIKKPQNTNNKNQLNLKSQCSKFQTII